MRIPSTSPHSFHQLLQTELNVPCLPILRLARGDTLFSCGQRLVSIYEVQAGQLMTTVGTREGRYQATGFPLPGEWLGLDAIASGGHAEDAQALTDAEVWPLPFQTLSELLRLSSSLQQCFHRILGEQIRRGQHALRMLGHMQAEQRIAVFLQDLTCRQAACGLSPHQVDLHMRRTDIGSFLGLKEETVSRILSRMHTEGILDVQYRTLCIIDPDRLQRLARGTVEPPGSAA